MELLDTIRSAWGARLVRWLTLASLAAPACGPSKALGLTPSDGGAGTPGGDDGPAAEIDGLPTGGDAAEPSATDTAPTTTPCRMTGPGTFAVTLSAGHVLSLEECLGMRGGPLILDQYPVPLNQDLAQWDATHYELLLRATGHILLHVYLQGEFDNTTPPHWDVDLTIVASNLTGVTVAADEAAVQLYDQTRGHILAQYADGTTADVTRWGRWIHPSDGVAVVDFYPILIPLRTGSVDVSASFFGRTGAGHIPVTDPPVSVAITAVAPTVPWTVGTTSPNPDLELAYPEVPYRFVPKLKVQVPGWTSSAPAVVTTSGTGATCKSAGMATLSVALSDRQVTVDVACAP